MARPCAPLIILAIAFYPVRIGFALIGQRFIGPDALWYAFPLGSLVSLVLAALYYRSGHWREQVLIVPPMLKRRGSTPMAGANRLAGSILRGDNRKFDK